jgi:four helix bundle protein
MATYTRFEELEIWQESRRLSLQVFNMTANGNVAKDFRFKDQIRSAAGSVMDNIAEGFERSSRLEFVNFLSFSKGSCGEVRSQIYRAIDQQYFTEEPSKILLNDYEKLAAKIAGFIAYLNKSAISGQKFKDR